MAILFVLALLVLALVNFAWELIPHEVFALLMISALVVTHVLTPAEAFGSFGNSSLVMIAAVMVLTGGVIHNGAAEVIGRRIATLAGQSERRSAGLLLAAVNGISAVINNVAATAMFIPVAEGIAHRFRVNRGKYLIPVAFASMTGGMCTLIGTSTNVAVAGVMPHYGLAPLGMFELAPVGIVVAITGLLYLLFLAPRFLRLPAEETEPIDAFGIRGFLFEVVVRPSSKLAGATLARTDLASLGLTVLAIVRGPARIVSPDGSEQILAGDLLLVEGEARSIPRVASVEGLEVKSLASPSSAGLSVEHVKMFEATVSYNSPFIGKTLKELNFRHRFGLSVLAVRRRGDPVIEKVGHIRLHAGDVLLIYGRAAMLDGLVREGTMLLIEDVPTPRHDTRRAIRAAAIFLGAVAVSALGWLDPPTAFLAGAALVLLTRCLAVEEAAGYVSFKFLILLAGMISLGVAMEQSGAAEMLARELIGVFPSHEPRLLFGVFFLVTVLLTQPLNNAAAALIVLPIAVHAAEALAVHPRPYAIAVAVAASCSFLTPFEPACLLVYSTGRYKFGDFFRVGSLLTMIAFGISLWLVPLLWPLGGP
jgi:di/tricarboxylate transporter